MSNNRPPDSTPLNDAPLNDAPRSQAPAVVPALTEQEVADRLTAARLLGQIDEEDEEVAATSPPRHSDWGAFGRGFAVGVMSDLLFGFLALALLRAGLNLYGPGLVAMTAAALLLVLILGSWTRPVALALIGAIAGLVATYAAFWFFIGPLLQAGRSDNPPAISAPKANEYRGNSGDVPS